MTEINPFSGYLAQTTQVQKQMAVDKEGQIRRAQNVAKNVALHGEQIENQVESTEAVTPIHEQEKEHDEFRKSRGHAKKSEKPDGEEDEGETHLDLTA